MKIQKTEEILLHSCCGPCAEYPLQQLLAEHYLPTLYYFNPNIQPQVEWQRRYESLAKLSDLMALPLVAVGSANGAMAGVAHQAERCRFCYRLRLEEVARMQKKTVSNLHYYFIGQPLSAARIDCRN